jgi:hypothetical protein
MSNPLDGVTGPNGPNQVKSIDEGVQTASLRSNPKNSISEMDKLKSKESLQNIQTQVSETKQVVDDLSTPNASKVIQSANVFQMLMGNIAVHEPMSQAAIKQEVDGMLKNFQPKNQELMGQSIWKQDLSQVDIKDALWNPEISKLMEAQCKTDSTGDNYNFLMAVHENLKNISDSNKPEEEVISDLKKNIGDVFCKPSSGINPEIKQQIMEAFAKNPPDLQEILSTLKTASAELTQELSGDLLNLIPAMVKTEKELTGFISSIKGPNNQFAELDKIINGTSKFDIPGVPRELIVEKAKEMKEELLPQVKSEFSANAKKAFDISNKQI